jgi:outer membrane biosynthesis protein TonB
LVFEKASGPPSTVIASVAIHAVALGAVYSSVNAADEAEKKVKEEQLVMLEIKPEPPAPPPEPVEPPPPPEPEPEPKPVPKAPRPVVTPPPEKPAPKPQVAKGTQTLTPPMKPPIGIPVEDRNAPGQSTWTTFPGRAKRVARPRAAQPA